MFDLIPHLSLPKTRPLEPMSHALIGLAEELRRDVTMLASDIGERNTRTPKSYKLAQEFCRTALAQTGLTVRDSSFNAQGHTCFNFEADVPGTTHPERIVLVGAHYDSVRGCPAANDNATGVAGTLALARRFAANPHPYTIRFALFANEEPPHFHTDTMGSLVYARMCKARGDQITCMYTLETIGCYSDVKGSQHWPSHPLTKFLPDVGNFILLLSDSSARSLVKRAANAFTAHTKFPMLSAALPNSVGDIGWSDHWSFQQVGYPGLLVTDTALFRYRHYHTPEDTVDKVDFDSAARVVDGFHAVTSALAR